MPKNKSVQRLDMVNGGSRRWATVEQVADHLGITTRTVRVMEADGRLRAYRGLGHRMLRFDLNEIDAAMTGLAQK